jgi:hypothetical protein
MLLPLKEPKMRFHVNHVTVFYAVQIFVGQEFQSILI